MKRAVFWLLTIFCVLNLNANANENLVELYQKATEFEKNGQIQNAMQIYKQIAEISLNLDENSANLQKQDSQNLQNEISENPRAIAKNSSNLQEQNSLNSPISEQKELFLGLKAYEPIYAVFAHDFGKKSDRKSNEIKFSFSLERPISYDLLGLDEKISLAYTQTSWWQIMQDSLPFRESNYAPEIFLQMPLSFANYTKFGIMHESNGKDGANSRSWNRIYAQASLSFGNLEIVPRIWYGFHYDSTNKDIDDYLGYGDLKLNYRYVRQLFSATLRNNLDFSDNKGAVQLDWFFPIFNSGFYGYLQYFSGYGESLVDYSRHVDKIGLGVAFRE